MTVFRLVRPLLTALAVAVLGVAFAHHAPWSATDFDPFVADVDNGYVDLVREGGSLMFVLSNDQGTLPAEMSSDLLPLDDEVYSEESGLLDRRHAISRFAGLAVETGTGWVVVQLEGDFGAIHDAILSRTADLGLTAIEDGAVIGGPVRSYRLTDGFDEYRIAISSYAEGALVHLQDMN